MGVGQIERCENCIGACDDAYRRNATEALFSDDLDLNEAIDQKRLMTINSIRVIAKCALSDEQIGNNLKELVEGKKNLYGREEV